MSPLKAQPFSVEYTLLGLLQPEPLHGYMLYKELTRPDGIRLVWYIKQSRMYAILKRLEDHGYLKVSIMPQDNRPARNIFQLTLAGKSALFEWLAKPVETPRQIRQELQLKLYFTMSTNPEFHQHLVDEQIKVCENWLRAQVEPASDTLEFVSAVRRFRQGQLEAMIAWLKSIKDSP